MVAFNTIKEGDILWDSRKVRMGNTTIRRVANYPVKVISIDPEKKTALASWNGNKATTYYPRQIAKLRRSKIEP